MWLSIVLSSIGFVAIFLEFFLPGALFALIGGILVISGVACFSLTDASLYYKIVYFTVNMLGVGLLCKLALWMFRSRKQDHLFLEGTQEGYTSHFLDKQFFGKSAEAQTDLKPSGHILVDGLVLQAISEREYIQKGKKIEIVTGRGAYYVVRETLEEKK